MHGYQLMQSIAERTGDAWRPSAGAIYPTIAQLEDEGLVVTAQEGGRRLVTLSEQGEAFLTERSAELGDPFAAFGDPDGGVDLRGASRAVQAAVRQIAVAGDADDRNAAAEILERTKRDLYLLLAGPAGRSGAATDEAADGEAE